ncbi:MAG: DUF1566 domain-containing protein [Chromatiaceae bacterium]|nr:DUF1566 domain-containing protein [Chromatiaceae bacterium]MBP6809543.1 DUF1566 domain-containing protein [Chromatiaceae bacterium]MBP8290940.1 DUF1566 domain-containing protein [Chromatiaceae bacterium]
MRGKQSTGWLVLLLVISMAPAVAQTCRDDIPASAPDSRFTANGDGTVTDRATGLIWKQCAEGLSGADCLTGGATAFTWQQALQHAEAAVFAGSSLWRLPNKKELASLVEQRCVAPAINARFFPNTPSNWFWSSSPYAGYSGSARDVSFDYGYVASSAKYAARYVRLVRGGQ